MSDARKVGTKRTHHLAVAKVSSGMFRKTAQMSLLSVGVHLRQKDVPVPQKAACRASERLAFVKCQHPALNPHLGRDGPLTPKKGSAHFLLTGRPAPSHHRHCHRHAANGSTCNGRDYHSHQGPGPRGPPSCCEACSAAAPILTLQEWSWPHVHEGAINQDTARPNKTEGNCTNISLISAMLKQQILPARKLATIFCLHSLPIYFVSLGGWTGTKTINPPGKTEKTKQRWTEDGGQMGTRSHRGPRATKKPGK